MPGRLRNSCNYTNHTLLPEALERWVYLSLKKYYPGIWRSFTRSIIASSKARSKPNGPGDDAKKSELIIEEGQPKMIRMAYLSVVGSTRVNSVAALHTDTQEASLLEFS